MKKPLIIITLLYALVYAGYDAFAFLDFGIGGRALSMGNASVATVDDATAFFWNPAKVGIANHTMVSGFFLMKPLGDWSLPGDNNMSFAYIQSLNKNSGLGISFYQFKVADIEYRRFENDDPFIISNTQHVFFLTYGRNVFNNLTMGINLKYFNQSFSEIEAYAPSANGLSADFGLYFIQSRFLNLGLMYQPAVKLSWNDSGRTEDEIPSKASLGIASNVFNNFVIGMDLRTKEDRPLRFCFGVEYDFAPFSDITDNSEKSFIGLKFRAGVRDLSLESIGRDNYGFTTGVGLNLAVPIGDISIDYAFIIKPNVTGLSHGLGLNLVF